jgi:acid phosphatase type 7
MISSYSNMDQGSTQYNWIVEELSKVDRSLTPWLIVVLHTPLYNTFSLHRHDPQIIAAKENLEELFVEYKVNLVFTGHIHAYLRTKNVAMDKLSPTGPIHITVGAGGRKCEAPFYDPVPEDWVEVRDATMYGYGMFHVFNRTHAQWDWVHTGLADDHSLNQIYRSNETLPAGPAVDRVLIENQFYLR